MSGEIPDVFDNLNKLTSLSIINAQFSGSIPPSIGTLSNLTSLSLRYNRLEGSIDFLANLTNLESADLSNNHLSGTIADEVGNLSIWSEHNGKGASLNTISFYMRTLRATINRAVDRGLISHKPLFKRVRTKMEKTAKRAIAIEFISRLKAVDLSEYPELTFSRDLFLFSFYTRGMSFVDIAYLKKRDLKNGEFTYRRSKTGQAIRVAWEPCMEAIVSQYSNPESEYMLPIITQPTADLLTQYMSVLS